MQTPCRILSMWAVQTTSEYGAHQWNLLDNQYPQLHKAYPIEFQHCAKPEHLQHLTFIRSKHTLENYCYKFNVLDGGVFPPGTQYGSISLMQFSGVGIVLQLLAQQQSLIHRLCCRHQPESDAKKVIVQDCTTAAVASIAGKYTSQLHMQSLKLHITVSIRVTLISN